MIQLVHIYFFFKYWIQISDKLAIQTKYYSNAKKDILIVMAVQKRRYPKESGEFFAFCSSI